MKMMIRFHDLDPDYSKYIYIVLRSGLENWLMSWSKEFTHVYQIPHKYGNRPLNISFKSEGKTINIVGMPLHAKIEIEGEFTQEHYKLFCKYINRIIDAYNNFKRESLEEDINGKKVSLVTLPLTLFGHYAVFGVSENGENLAEKDKQYLKFKELLGDRRIYL